MGPLMVGAAAPPALAATARSGCPRPASDSCRSGDRRPLVRDPAHRRCRQRIRRRAGHRRRIDVRLDPMGRRWQEEAPPPLIDCLICQCRGAEPVSAHPAALGGAVLLTPQLLAVVRPEFPATWVRTALKGPPSDRDIMGGRGNYCSAVHGGLEVVDDIPADAVGPLLLASRAAPARRAGPARGRPGACMKGVSTRK
jgi:hypothetical protein